MQINFNEWVDNHTFACYNVCTKSIEGCSNVVNHTPKGGDNDVQADTANLLRVAEEASEYAAVALDYRADRFNSQFNPARISGRNDLISAAIAMAVVIQYRRVLLRCWRWLARR